MSFLRVDNIQTTDGNTTIPVSEMLGVNSNKVSSIATSGSVLKFGESSGSPSVDVSPLSKLGIQFNKSVTQSDDYGIICVNRKAGNSGGTAGYVGSAIRATTDVTNKSHTQFEWSIIGIVNNYADSSEKVGIYAQGNKHGKGGTWGGVWEACDFNDRVSAAGDGLTWGGEIDVWTDFADTAGVRRGLTVVVGSKVNIRDGLTPGQQATASCGINVTSYGNNFNYAAWQTGINIDQVIGSAIRITGGGTRGIDINSGSYSVGLDVSQATISGPAIRLGLGNAISFDSSDERKLAVSGGALQYTKNNTQLFAILDDGTGIVANALKLNGSRVSIDAALSTTATAGGASAPPATVSGYLSVTIDGVVKKIPYYS